MGNKGTSSQSVWKNILITVVTAIAVSVGQSFWDAPSQIQVQNVKIEAIEQSLNEITALRRDFQNNTEKFNTRMTELDKEIERAKGREEVKTELFEGFQRQLDAVVKSDQDQNDRIRNVEKDVSVLKSRVEG